MKAKIITTGILLGIALSIALISPVRADNYNIKLNQVYNVKRINAFKNVIRYYNSGVDDDQAGRIARSIIYFSHVNKIEDDRFVCAVITIESMFNPTAVSRTGAMGLGQLMPGTASNLSVNNPFSIEGNVNACCIYLKRQLDRFSNYPRQQQYEYTLAAYKCRPRGGSKIWRDPAIQRNTGLRCKCH